MLSGVLLIIGYLFFFPLPLANEVHMISFAIGCPLGITIAFLTNLTISPCLIEWYPEFFTHDLMKKLRLKEEQQAVQRRNMLPEGQSQGGGDDQDYHSAKPLTENDQEKDDGKEGFTVEEFEQIESQTWFRFTKTITGPKTKYAVPLVVYTMLLPFVLRLRGFHPSYDFRVLQ